MTEHEKLVERVARALAPLMTDQPWQCECDAHRGMDCDCGDSMQEERRDRHDEDLCRDDVRGFARAAIATIYEALKYPGPDMQLVGASKLRGNGLNYATANDAEDVFQAMLDASPLNPNKKGDE